MKDIVSIIVPVYNAEKYIIQTIESVAAQTFTDWELLLVDDCGPDNSAQVIGDYIAAHGDDRIRLIRQEKNGGAAAARNRGVAEAQGRYIAFLDADDLWMPAKLELELQFMKKHDAGFVFCAYEFGDSDAVPTGKIVHVPRKLTYKKALSRTVIFTSTVLFDLEKIDRNLVMMPAIASEDTATWWRILKNGHVAYGLDQPLVLYRRPEQSLSSDKKVAVKRIWNLYRKEEGKSVFGSFLLLIGWAYRATLRRVLDDTIHGHIEAIKRFAALQLSLVGLLLYSGIFAVWWHTRLYPILSMTRYSREGNNLGIGIRFYFRGHLLMFLVYLVILAALSNSTGGVKTGYLKPGRVFSSEVIALFLTNVITYFQLSFMKNWLFPLQPFVLMFLSQIVVAGIWAYFSDLIYRHVFPARETLVVDFSGKDARGNEITGSYENDIVTRLETRPDRFEVIRVMRGFPMDQVQEECLKWYGCVVIQGGTEQERSELMKFCNRHYIRVYLIPEISDLLKQGMVYMDLFDMPMLELKEYSIRWEAALLKRLIDILTGAAGLVLCLPLIIVNRLRGKKMQSALFAGRHGKAFRRRWYDTRFGHLPDFWNVFCGTMSLVGPMPIEKAHSDRLVKQDRWYAYCFRLKPGMTGYAQINGSEETTESERLKMDVYYSQNFSLVNDFKLVVQSIRR